MNSLIHVVPRTTYTTANVAAPGTTEIVLAKLVNTAAFVSAALIVRIHTSASVTGWVVSVQNVSMSEEEPNTVFSTTTGEQPAAIPNGATPNLVVLALNTPISHFVRVLLRTPNNQNTSVTISVDINGRDA